jgi:hypothetical protein
MGYRLIWYVGTNIHGVITKVATTFTIIIMENLKSQLRINLGDVNKSYQAESIPRTSC